MKKLIKLHSFAWWHRYFLRAGYTDRDARAKAHDAVDLRL